MLTHKSAPQPATIATPTGGTEADVSTGIISDLAREAAETIVQCSTAQGEHLHRMVMRTTRSAGAASDIVKRGGDESYVRWLALMVFC